MKPEIPSCTKTVDSFEADGKLVFVQIQPLNLMISYSAEFDERYHRSRNTEEELRRMLAYLLKVEQINIPIKNKNSILFKFVADTKQCLYLAAYRPRHWQHQSQSQHYSTGIRLNVLLYIKGFPNRLVSIIPVERDYLWLSQAISICRYWPSAVAYIYRHLCTLVCVCVCALPFAHLYTAV